MDTAVGFYTGVLGLALVERHGNHIAFVNAGPGLTIALHPVTPAATAPPGTRGAVQIGLEIDEPIERVVSRLQERGARMSGDIVTFEAGKCVSLEDPDGNPIYLWERATDEDVPETDLESAGRART
jgi:catechol 2,3-dioxygenase-like lactoylglutathione lyase family enzyme